MDQNLVIHFCGYEKLMIISERDIAMTRMIYRIPSVRSFFLTRKYVHTCNMIGGSVQLNYLEFVDAKCTNHDMKCNTFAGKMQPHSNGIGF